MSWRNPWPSDLKLPDQRRDAVRSQERLASQWWRGVTATVTARLVMRLRDGARHACKRLRGERDVMRAVMAARGHVIDALTEERDAARLELRALEWLLIHHPDELRALVMADGDKSGRYSYCARALGWEG